MSTVLFGLGVLIFRMFVIFVKLFVNTWWTIYFSKFTSEKDYFSPKISNGRCAQNIRTPSSTRWRSMAIFTSIKQAETSHSPAPSCPYAASRYLQVKTRPTGKNRPGRRKLDAGCDIARSCGASPMENTYSGVVEGCMASKARQFHWGRYHEPGAWGEQTGGEPPLLWQHAATLSSRAAIDIPKRKKQPSTIRY